MQISKLISTAAVALSLLAAPLAVAAHVVVQPGQVTAGSSQLFTVFVPTEKDVPTTKVRLVIADGASNVTPLAKAGWTVTTVKTGEGENAVVSEITWSGGEIAPELKDQFQFTAKATGNVDTLKWKAYQTYQDGTVVAWDMEPETIPAGEEGTPYSTTLVVKSSLESDNSALQSQLDSTNSNVTLALALAALALGFSMVGLFQSGRRENK